MPYQKLEDKLANNRLWRSRNPAKFKEIQVRWRKGNPDKVRAQDRSWRRRNPEKMKQINLRARLKKAFGMTEADYELLLEAQGGKCAICERPPRGPRRLHVDHCHRTGVIRGLLCASCNPALGIMKDSPELLRKAAEYLERFRPKPTAGI